MSLCGCGLKGRLLSTSWTKCWRYLIWEGDPIIGAVVGLLFFQNKFSPTAGIVMRPRNSKYEVMTIDVTIMPSCVCVCVFVCVCVCCDIPTNILTRQCTTMTFCLSALSHASMLRQRSTIFSRSGVPR